MRRYRVQTAALPVGSAAPILLALILLVSAACNSPEEPAGRVPATDPAPTATSEPTATPESSQTRIGTPLPTRTQAPASFPWEPGYIVDELTSARTPFVATGTFAGEHWRALMISCNPEAGPAVRVSWRQLVDYDYWSQDIEVSWQADGSDVQTERWSVGRDGDTTFSNDPLGLFRQLGAADEFVVRTATLDGEVTIAFDTRGLLETLVLQRRFVEMDGCCFLYAPKALGVAGSKQCLARYNFASMMTAPGKPSL